MNIFLLIILRLVHVVAGILWGGAPIYYLFFIKPSVKAIGAIGPQFNFTHDITNIVWFDDPVRGFEAAARNGTLPPVTIIEPDYIDLPPGNDDHPPADMADGQILVERIVKALIDSPTWESTLFIITYDEHGGFYDHVDPPGSDAVPPVPPLGGDLKKLGPRVPTFVISPLIERGAVFHSRFDHTSIGATILRRFVGGQLARPPRISPRMDAARDLREVLTLDRARPRSDFAGLFTDLRLQIAPRSATHRSARIGIPDSPKEDFHWLLSAMRLITGEPPKISKKISKTVIDLNGRWTAGDPRRAVISTEFPSITIDMSAYRRPAAHGSIIDHSNIKVTFPDDKTYTGKIELPNKIRWPNNTVWTKI